MKTKLSVAGLLLLVCLGFYAFRIADDPFELLLEKLSAYNEDHPQEKVHLHLDKPYYAIGDDIWFKAYITDSRTGGPSMISSALYVELIGENDSLKKQIKLPVMSGITLGDFKLPDTLQEGNYRIRAYTQWMRNAGPDYFFDKTIKIGNAWANKVFTSTTSVFSKNNNNAESVSTVIKFTDKQGKPYAGNSVNYVVTLKDKVAERSKAVTNESGEITVSYVNKQPAGQPSGNITATLTLANKQQVIKVIPVKATSNAVSVQFFPEGGNMVENLPSKVGIKAVNAAGLGEDITGTIVDNDGTEIFTISTTHLGMGSFTLNPVQGRSYTAKIKLKDGTTQDVPLPKALPAGYIITLSNTDSAKVNLRILLSQSLLGKGELKLLFQHNNNTYSVLKAKGEKQVIVFSVPVKDMPSGLTNLTLFSAENIPVAQRLIFINNRQDQIDTRLTNLKPTYGKRENVTLEMVTKDGDKPTQGSFSVAVTNTSVIQPDLDNESNILTSLLLKSDLKGYIEKPNYYFLKNDKKTREDLDHLMLTQGWSRILWKDVLGGNAGVPLYPAEKSLKISGTITTEGGKPIVNGRVSLFSTSGGFFMIDTLTDAKGRFNFQNLVFADSTKFLVQARNAKNKKYVEIKLDLIPGQVITKNPNTGDIEVNVNEAIQGYIRQSEDYFNDLAKRGLLQRTFLLDQVNIVQKKQEKSNSTNLNGAGQADLVIGAKDLNRCVTLSQCLQGRVAGLMIREGKAFLLRNGNTPMQVYVDGMMLEPDFLDQINPNDIETVEILKSVNYTALYGFNGSGGVIIITTKRGGGAISTYAPGITTFTPKGYYAMREFYSPKYTPENTNTGIDRRSTVYWGPNLITDINGNVKFNFYNTDETGTYRVVIEGMNNEGHLARKVYTYEVK